MNNRMSKVLFGLAALSGLGLAGCATVASNSSSADSAGPAPTQANMVGWHCDQLRVETIAQGDDLMLYARDKSWRLQHVVSASGAKYQSTERPYTVFWQKGRTANVALEGQEMRNCVEQSVFPLPLTARGNEPFWTLTLTDSAINFNPMQGSEVPAGVKPSVSLTQQVCTDTMTGMPYPYRARVHYNGEVLNGCGGETVQLLTDTEWVVQQLNGEPVEQNAPSLRFHSDGRISGNASCNRYFGEYSITGEGIALKNIGATRMACAPIQMHQEQQFLALLNSVTSLQFDAVGALVLSNGTQQLRLFAL